MAKISDPFWTSAVTRADTPEALASVFKLRHGGDVRCTTAFPPKAEKVHRRSCYVAQVPGADSCAAAKFHHSITVSARSRSRDGMVMPIVCAVFRLITRRNLVGCHGSLQLDENASYQGGIST
jgi:hypothetical protein